MKWTHSELQQSAGETVVFDEVISIEPSAFAGNSRINDVRDIHVEGQGYLDEDDDLFYVQMNISGTMLVPDAVTGEEVEYPFETETEETYSFVASAEDGVRVVAEEVVELLPAVVDEILLEVPLQVTYASEEDYPHGDGWRVISEEEYQKSQEQRLDPPLAKLKSFMEEE